LSSCDDPQETEPTGRDCHDGAGGEPKSSDFVVPRSLAPVCRPNIAAATSEQWKSLPGALAHRRVAVRLRARLKPRMHKLLWLAAGGIPLAFVVGYLIGRFLL
jgi:hypothetical protein